MITREQASQLKGATVMDQDGDKVGSVEDIYLDRETDEPEWILVNTGLFGTKSTFIPLREARLEGGQIMVPYDKDHIKAAPKMDPDGELSQEEEQGLYSHYGLGYSEYRSDTGLPEGEPTTTTGGETVTRAEEELRVGTRPVEAGGVRLRKWVETEPATAEVETRRETARVEREPINQPVGDAAIGEQEVEVPLQAEEPVVGKETVAKERVTVDKDVETRPETVTEEVRKEQVEVDDTTRRGRRR